MPFSKRIGGGDTDPLSGQTAIEVQTAIAASGHAAQQAVTDEATAREGGDIALGVRVDDEQVSRAVVQANLDALVHVRAIVKVGNQFSVTSVDELGVPHTVLLIDETGGGGGGADGTMLFVAALPDVAVGNDGDTAFNTSNGEIYKKAGGVWAVTADVAIQSELLVRINVLTGLINLKADATALADELVAREFADTAIGARIDNLDLAAADGTTIFTDAPPLPEVGNDGDTAIDPSAKVYKKAGGVWALQTEFALESQLAFEINRALVAEGVITDIAAGARTDINARIDNLQHVRSITKVGFNYTVEGVDGDGAEYSVILVDETGGSGGTADGTFLFGDAAPVAGDGADGDTWFYRATGKFYKKAAGVWTELADAVLTAELTTQVATITGLINAKADASAFNAEVLLRAKGDLLVKYAVTESHHDIVRDGYDFVTKLNDELFNDLRLAVGGAYQGGQSWIADENGSVNRSFIGDLPGTATAFTRNSKHRYAYSSLDRRIYYDAVSGSSVWGSVTATALPDDHTLIDMHATETHMYLLVTAGSGIGLAKVVLHAQGTITNLSTLAFIAITGFFVNKDNAAALVVRGNQLFIAEGNRADPDGNLPNGLFLKAVQEDTFVAQEANDLFFSGVSNVVSIGAPATGEFIFYRRSTFVAAGLAVVDATYSAGDGIAIDDDNEITARIDADRQGGVDLVFVEGKIKARGTIADNTAIEAGLDDNALVSPKGLQHKINELPAGDGGSEPADHRLLGVLLVEGAQNAYDFQPDNKIAPSVSIETMLDDDVVRVEIEVNTENAVVSPSANIDLPVRWLKENGVTDNGVTVANTNTNARTWKSVRFAYGTGSSTNTLYVVPGKTLAGSNIELWFATRDVGGNTLNYKVTARLIPLGSIGLDARAKSQTYNLYIYNDTTEAARLGNFPVTVVDNYFPNFMNFTNQADGSVANNFDPENLTTIQTDVDGIHIFEYIEDVVSDGSITLHSGIPVVVKSNGGIHIIGVPGSGPRFGCMHREVYITDGDGVETKVADESTAQIRVVNGKLFIPFGELSYNYTPLIDEVYGGSRVRYRLQLSYDGDGDDPFSSIANLHYYLESDTKETITQINPIVAGGTKPRVVLYDAVLDIDDAMENDLVLLTPIPDLPGLITFTWGATLNDPQINFGVLDAAQVYKGTQMDIAGNFVFERDGENSKINPLSAATFNGGNLLIEFAPE